MTAPALVALAHGSRDPRSAETIKALVDEVRALRPDLRIEPAFLDLCKPAFPVVVDRRRHRPLHRRERRAGQPAAVRRLSLDRLLAVHPPGGARRGPAQRSLGGSCEDRVRHQPVAPTDTVVPFPASLLAPRSERSRQS